MDECPFYGVWYAGDSLALLKYQVLMADRVTPRDLTGCNMTLEARSQDGAGTFSVAFAITSAVTGWISVAPGATMTLASGRTVERFKCWVKVAQVSPAKVGYCRPPFTIELRPTP